MWYCEEGQGILRKRNWKRGEGVWTTKGGVGSNSLRDSGSRL